MSYKSFPGPQTFWEGEAFPGEETDTTSAPPVDLMTWPLEGCVPGGLF